MSSKAAKVSCLPLIPLARWMMRRHHAHESNWRTCHYPGDILGHHVTHSRPTRPRLMSATMTYSTIPNEQPAPTRLLS
jgi:hypothetical protein